MSQPRGRPPLVRGEPSTSISVKVSSGVYDKAYALARRDRVSLPEVLRRALRQLLDDDDEADE